MDVFARRAIVMGHDNPGGRTDYVAGLEGRIEPPAYGGDVGVVVRYVPDRLVLAPDSFEAYLATVEDIGWSSLEEMAAAMVANISNEMLTRWTQVNLRAASRARHGSRRTT